MRSVLYDILFVTWLCFSNKSFLELISVCCIEMEVSFLECECCIRRVILISDLKSTSFPIYYVLVKFFNLMLWFMSLNFLFLSWSSLERSDFSLCQDLNVYISWLGPESSCEVTCLMLHVLVYHNCVVVWNCPHITM